MENEEAVLGELVFTSLMKVDSEEKAVIVANLIYSYDVIARAARSVTQVPRFQDDEKLQKLKISRTWVSNWLRRNAMRRRRVTAHSKQLPSPELVQARMAEIQKVVIDGKYDATEVFNGDETGMVFGAQPKYQYLGSNADRATVPDADDKSRFTSFVFANAKGEVKPTFNIIKCSTKNAADFTGTRVVGNLLAEPGFGAEHIQQALFDQHRHRRRGDLSE